MHGPYMVYQFVIIYKLKLMIYCSNITVTTTMLLRAKNTVNHCVSTQSREQLIGLKIQPLSDPQQRHLTIEPSEALREVLK